NADRLVSRSWTRSSMICHSTGSAPEAPQQMRRQQGMPVVAPTISSRSKVVLETTQQSRILRNSWSYQLLRCSCELSARHNMARLSMDEPQQIPHQSQERCQ